MTKFSSAALLPAGFTYEKRRRWRLRIAWNICPTKGNGNIHIRAHWVVSPLVSPAWEEALLRELTLVWEAERCSSASHCSLSAT